MLKFSVFAQNHSIDRFSLKLYNVNLPGPFLSVGRDPMGFADSVVKHLVEPFRHLVFKGASKGSALEILKLEVSNLVFLESELLVTETQFARQSIRDGHICSLFLNKHVLT